MGSHRVDEQLVLAMFPRIAVIALDVTLLGSPFRLRRPMLWPVSAH
jgi:hypothetical protein